MGNKEALRRADAKYKKKTYTQLAVRFHNVNEKDVIDKLASVENKRQYLIDLIRSDIRENGM